MVWIIIFKKIKIYKVAKKHFSKRAAGDTVKTHTHTHTLTQTRTYSYALKRRQHPLEVTG